jgi:membrane-associated phospholipid phosphatase
METSAEKMSYKVILPLVRERLFFGSLVTAVAFMAILASPLLRGSSIGSSTGFFAELTYYLDPFICHIIGWVIVAYLISRHLFYSNIWVDSTKKRWLLGLTLPAVILIGFFVLEQCVLKPSFAYPKSASSIGEPFLIDMIVRNLGYEPDSCPSGTVLRQAILLLLGLTFVCKRGKQNSEQKGILSALSVFCLLILTLFVAISRVYRGQHTVEDIGITLGVACYIYWLAYYTCGKLFSRLPERSTQSITAASCLMIPTFYLNSHDAHWWVIVGVVLFCFIGLVDLVSNRRVSLNGDELL